MGGDPSWGRGKPPPVPPPAASAAGLHFTVNGCTRSANSVECRLTVVARQDQDQDVRVACDNWGPEPAAAEGPATPDADGAAASSASDAKQLRETRAYDNGGRELRCGRATLAGQRTSGIYGREVVLVAGVGVPLVLVFEGATEQSAALARLDVAFAMRMGGWSGVQFRNVALRTR